MSFIRMQLRRIVIMMIIEYAVPSLALNYPCKEYHIIYESVHIYLCTCMRNKYLCKSEFVWNVHIQVMLKLIRHVLVETFVARGIVLKFPDWQSNVHFPWPNELTICPDSNGFQNSTQSSCTGHRWPKAKDFFVFCSGKICLVLFQGCCSFVLRHLCPVHEINAQTPVTTILTTHLLHEFIVNVKHRMDWSYGKPYICLSFNFWKQYPADRIIMFYYSEYAEICHLPLTSLKESNFSWLVLKFPELINCPLWVKELIFLAFVTDVTH